MSREVVARFLALIGACSVVAAGAQAEGRDDRAPSPETVAPSRRAAVPRPPNVVLFLVDDLGWADPSAYDRGGRFSTPRIDAFAAEGMRFTDAYAASSICSPTRASLLTGKYPERLHFTEAWGHRAPVEARVPIWANAAAPVRPFLFPRSTAQIEASEHTIAERLAEVGYRTGHVGKWHLGTTKAYQPEAHGFDVAVYGAPDHGPQSYVAPYGFTVGPLATAPGGEYLTDRVTDEALEFLEENAERPFLLHVWHFAVHGPLHAADIDIPVPGSSDRIVSPQMASMVATIDRSLGRVLDKLAELGLDENTIVIFTSDNGGNSGVEGRPSVDASPHALEAYRRFAAEVPPTSNAPLLHGKGWANEGGTRVPLIVRWPGVVAAGSTCSFPVSSIDYAPTILAATETDATGGDFDGVDLVPLLRGEGVPDRDELFWYFPHPREHQPAGAVVRRGSWKLIRWYETDEEHGELFELYDLAADIGESRNLAAERPDLVRELSASIDCHLDDVGAYLPIPNPAFEPARAGRRWLR